jgi:hypothetical protein
MSNKTPSETHTPIDSNEEHQHEGMSQSELEGTTGGIWSGIIIDPKTHKPIDIAPCPPGAMC